MLQTPSTEAGQAEDGYGSDGSCRGRLSLLGARYRLENVLKHDESVRRRDICPGRHRCARRLNYFIFIMS